MNIQPCYRVSHGGPQAPSKHRTERVMDYQLIIRNGTIIDGTGADRYQADIAVSNGRIVKIGQISGTAE
ncbi:MAG: hypothetical protein O3B72_11645, partial [Proteobacteria bacterium]|nr:hypothetical protein [Pseudomonadota bacterium]